MRPSLRIRRRKREHAPPKPEAITPANRSRPRIGLALGAGAARGWSHIGVLKTLLKHGIAPDIVAGTSIGAVVGGCWAAGELDALETFALSLTRRGMLGLVDVSFSGSGLVSGTRLRRMLDAGLGDLTFEELSVRFVAVSTEFGTGREVWLRHGHLVTAMRASYAIPGVFEPVEVDGRWLLDGAMVNPVPVTAARALGAEFVIAVGVNNDHRGRGTTITEQFVPRPQGQSEQGVTENIGRTRNGWLLGSVRDAASLVTRQLTGRPASAPPGIAAVMVDAINITQDRIARARLAGDPPDVMIGPKLGAIGLFDFNRAQEAIEIGMRAAERVMPEIEDGVRGFDAHRSL